MDMQKPKKGIRQICTIIISIVTIKAMIISKREKQFILTLSLTIGVKALFVKYLF